MAIDRAKLRGPLPKKGRPLTANQQAEVDEFREAQDQARYKSYEVGGVQPPVSPTPISNEALTFQAIDARIHSTAEMVTEAVSRAVKAKCERLEGRLNARIDGVVTNQEDNPSMAESVARLAQAVEAQGEMIAQLLAHIADPVARPKRSLTVRHADGGESHIYED
jgi:hypothetical protein